MGFMNALKKPIQGIGKAVGKMAPPGMKPTGAAMGIGPSPKMAPPPPMNQMAPPPQMPMPDQGTDMGQMTDQMAQPAMPPPPQPALQMMPPGLGAVGQKISGLAPRPSFMGKLASKLKPRF